MLKKSKFIKTLVLLVWLVVAVVVIWFSASLFTRSINNDLDGMFSGLKSLFKAGDPGYSDPRSLFNNKIVEEESTVIDVVEDVSPAVVSIIIKSYVFDFFSGPSLEESGIGTGIIVDKSGLVVTNSHVVDNPNGEYSVVLKDGTTYTVDKIHLDKPTDLAILEITARDLPVTEIGDSDSLKVGQIAIAIGNALGRYQNTVTVGVISGIARELQASSGFGEVKTYEGVIQTDAALNPGNSGGPLLNSSGQVIGINVATSLGADNISFAIPINTLKPILEGFLEEGRIVRPYLGVVYTMVTPDIASLRDLPEGAFVSRVITDSPADEAKMERGDIIVRFDDEAVNADNPLGTVISKKKVGDRIKVIVDRAGEELTMTVVLKEAPETL